MNELRNKKEYLITGMIYIIWLIAMFTFSISGIFKLVLNPNFYMSILMGSIAFVVSLTYFIMFKNSKKDISEIQHVSTVITIAYLIINLCINFLYGISIYKMNTNFLVNIMLLFAYVLAIIFSEEHVLKTERKIAKLEKKSSMHKEVSGQITRLLARAKDKELRDKILSMKQIFDYSNALANEKTGDIDAQILSKIKSLNLENGDKKEILESLEDIIADIKYRNAIK